MASAALKCAATVLVGFKMLCADFDNSVEKREKLLKWDIVQGRILIKDIG